MRTVVILIGLIAITGCVRDPIPVYPRTSVDESFAIINRRNAEIQTVQGQAEIVLTDAAGRSVRLDGAFVMRPPNEMRVRAWKLGQAVFDLTLNPDGVYQFVGRDEARQSMPATRKVLEHWMTMLFGDVGRAGSQIRDDPQHIRATTQLAGETQEVRTFDRPTLTQRSVDLMDATGKRRFLMEMDQYQVLGGNVWPMRVRAVSDDGLITIRFQSVDLNVPLAPNAFKPPSRAERVP
ncbi:MAG: hypothetical protein H7144_07240 [Burkholderiales bacterium]|nr:hypothetical protein [Phycisphaerae bacterium]